MGREGKRRERNISKAVFEHLKSVYNATFDFITGMQMRERAGNVKIHHPGEMKTLSDYAFTFHAGWPAGRVGDIMFMYNILPEATFQNFPPLAISLKNALLTLTKMTTSKVFFPLSSGIKHSSRVYFCDLKQ